MLKEVRLLKVGLSFCVGKAVLISKPACGDFPG